MIYDVLIIGGGASAMACAVAAGRRGLTVAIAEKNSRVGKKILATGNGRCNFTNVDMDIVHFHSENMDKVAKALHGYTHEIIIDFFSSIGCIHREKDGRVYPYSNLALNVVDCLRNALKVYKVEEICEFEVTTAYKSNHIFVAENQKGNCIQAKNLVVACGGFAADGSKTGYDILKAFGHKLIKTYPALVQLKTTGDFTKSLKGVKYNGVIKAYCDGAFVSQEEGEILFTDYGISGIAVMQLSYLYSQYDNMAVILDFLCDKNESDVQEYLYARRVFFTNTDTTVEDFLSGLVNKRLGHKILKLSGIDKLSLRIRDLTDKQINATTKQLKDTRLEVAGHNGFSNAQVSGGGISLDEFNAETLESNRVSGLYAVGEVLDVFGDCGGYNLHWAWSSGLKVAANCK